MQVGHELHELHELNTEYIFEITLITGGGGSYAAAKISVYSPTTNHQSPERALGY